MMPNYFRWRHLIGNILVQHESIVPHRNPLREDRSLLVCFVDLGGSVLAGHEL